VLQQARDAALDQVKTLTEEGNQLRGMIRNLETELARASGYMQAIEDAKPPKPPRMIEVHDDHDNEVREGRDTSGMLELPVPGDRYAKNRKGWWER
jgi:hypothetical protein